MDTCKSMAEYIKGSDIEQDEKIIQSGLSFSLNKIFDDVACVSSFLNYNGVKKGDSVMICLPNIVQAVIALYAINMSGAVANIVHPKIGTDALIKIATDTKTKWVFIYDKLFVKHRKGLAAHEIKSVVCKKTDYNLTNKKAGKIEPYTVTGNSVAYKKTLVVSTNEAREIGGEDPAVYLHSSGTTGDPKTVVLSNRAMNELSENINDVVKPVPGKCAILMTLPMFHGFGLGVCVHLAMAYCKIIMLPVFTAKRAIKLLKKYPINYMAVVPNMLRKMMAEKGFSGKQLEPLIHIYVGGDKLDETLRKQAMQRMKEANSNCLVCEGFGLSEVASVTHINLDGKEGGTVGKPIRGVKVKIVRDGGEVKSGELGEIYLSSKSMMNGYLGQDADFEYLNGELWLRTGDIGSVDDQGFLYYKGREKRMIKIGGINVFPQEIESIAGELPEIKSACAVRTIWKGKPAIKLLVELKNGKMTAKLKNKICDTISSNIMPYATPKYVESVKNMKRTGIGKTDYRYYEQKENK